MLFCSGPPRSYAPPQGDAATADEPPFEAVAVAMHPSEMVFARVSPSLVSLWAASASSELGATQRLLASCPRSGAVTWASDAVIKAENGKLLVRDAGWSGMRSLWASWLFGDRLAVVEKGSHLVEFYTFDGLHEMLAAAASPHTSSQAEHTHNADESAANGASGQAPVAPTGEQEAAGPRPTQSAGTLRAKFVVAYNLNEGEAQSDTEAPDAATAASAIPGSRFLFVGMSSGLITVVEVAGDDAEDGGKLSSWFGGSKSGAHLWKIDVLPHLTKADAGGGTGDQSGPGGADKSGHTATHPSCYVLSCASSEPAAHVTSIYLVACFEGGKCFIMLLSPLVKAIEQLLSLVNTERDGDTTSCYGRCTHVAMDTKGSRLALGWSDGGVSLFQLKLQRVEQPPVKASATPTPVALALEPIRELSLVAWGYSKEDIGGVTSLAWSHDSRSVAVGYELRGFSLFSTDGCRLMSTLPQHNQQRPEGIDIHAMKEACAFGVAQLMWSRESFSLIVIPRGRQHIVRVPVALDRTPDDLVQDEVQLLDPSQLFEEYSVELLKDEDGLCLSLSGAPNRCGAWVRSEASFTRRAHSGDIGPAEASGRIQGGDLLVGVNGDMEIVNFYFEDVIHLLKDLPVNEQVTLTFLRLNWELVFPLAAEALSSSTFMETHGLQLLADEDLCIREFGLRMQALNGDCDMDKCPPLLEFERRAKFHGWEAMQGTPTLVAIHKYVKLLFAVFPVWNPRHFMNVLCEFDNSSRKEARDQELARLHGSVSAPDNYERVQARESGVVSFLEFDFAKNVPLAGGKSSHLVLLERSAVRIVAASALDDPCALTSCASWDVPTEFERKCCPLRHVAVSASGNQIAVAGQRGFCLLNLLTGKWRMFGNVNEEQDITVFSMMWVGEDAIVVNFSRESEHHKTLHLQAYPRNHLDEESILDQISFTRRGGGAQHHNANTATASSNTVPESMDTEVDDCFYVMESDESQMRLFCISQRELWYFSMNLAGSIKTDDLRLQLRPKRQVNLPTRLMEAQRTSRCGLSDFAVLPRYLHISDDKLREQQLRKFQAERDQEQQDDGWFLGIVNMLVGGEVPDQYTPEEVLPRFAFLDLTGDVIVWDPEDRSQRLLCSNVSTMARILISPRECPSWPTPCRLLYGLYGPDGMKIWIPLLDGVYLTHSKAFEEDERRLKTFLACHDPLRAKTYEIEFGTAPATAELYELVLKEYGVILESFLASGLLGKPLDEGHYNLRGCITSVDDPLAVDGMLRFDSDVKVVGVQQTFGLLVGLSQDVYVPQGVALPCYDVFARVQPIFHTLLCFLVQNGQLEWAATVLRGVHEHFALSTPTQELFLHSMLEACFSKRCTEDKLHTTMGLLRPAGVPGGPENTNESNTDNLQAAQGGDVEEYCEIVAHVARKSEPSRLKLLFPAAGDPLDLMVACQQRSELRTAANFLLILEECSTASSSSSSLRTAAAAALVAQCIEHEEWVLAQHVVRVARDWSERPSEAIGSEGETAENVRGIDERLAVLAWDNLVRGEYERVAWSVEELQAKLPRRSARELELASSLQEDDAVVFERLVQVFIRGNKRRQLRILLQAVTEARYDAWIAMLKRVAEQ